MPKQGPTIIVAMDAAGGIGKDNQLPWHLPEDLKHFQRTTKGHAVVMGHNTYRSLPAAFRPLPHRHNIVLTRDHQVDLGVGAHRAGSLAEALRIGYEKLNCEEVFIIGGAQIYKQALPLVDRLIVTQLGETYACDAYFPAIYSHEWDALTRETVHSLSAGTSFQILGYYRKPVKAQR